MQVSARLYAVSPALADSFTSLYSFELDAGDGARVRDLFAPEWCTLVMTADGAPPRVGIVPHPRKPWNAFGAGGPATSAIDIEMSNSRVFTLSLSPLGWARHVDADASAYVDRLVDGDGDPAFARFAGLLDILRESGGEGDDLGERIYAHLRDMATLDDPNEARVAALQDALRDPAITDVGTLAERIGTSRRTLERLALRYFGFSPKTLLRRQRFICSLARYMAAPEPNWSTALDPRYVDQAHFVRDFRFFMGVTPSQYMAMDHPILGPVAMERLADHGAVLAEPARQGEAWVEAGGSPQRD